MQTSYWKQFLVCKSYTGTVWERELSGSWTRWPQGSLSTLINWLLFDYFTVWIVKFQWLNCSLALFDVVMWTHTKRSSWAKSEAGDSQSSAALESTRWTPAWSHSTMQTSTAIDFCSFSVSMVWKNKRLGRWENSWQCKIHEQENTKWLGDWKIKAKQV